ncbi:FecR/PupR family sigma factor regulator [Sphingomonas sp. MG17]|uniref:FecR/PupR family sigma factor regulator n=1 Tax=Sphingomonas tagetis TaxID=2949092 RepID=A0A9X2HLB4_9SPHN|nr:FecR/PupR family sigma factor regulator [Sphingomonas tagetis]MCP3730611.1 FecR/PupR family sigma factor regulator [Sphingomonas tagetis]
MAEGNNILPLPQSARIEAEAAAWVARLDRDEASESDRIAFQAWCGMSELHRQAVERLSSLWTDLDRLRGSSSIEPRVTPSSESLAKQAPLQP